MAINTIRKKLDKADNELIKVLAKRMALIPSVAEYKIKNNVKRYQPEREKQILDKNRKIAKKSGLNPDLVEGIFRKIIKDAHRIEKKMMGK